MKIAAIANNPNIFSISVESEIDKLNNLFEKQIDRDSVYFTSLLELGAEIKHLHAQGMATDNLLIRASKLDEMSELLLNAVEKNKEVYEPEILEKLESFAAVVKFFSLDLIGFKLIVQVSTELQVDEFSIDENNRQLDLKSCALGLEIIAQAFRDYSRVIPNNALEDGKSLADICLEIASKINSNDYETESKEVVDELKERLEHSAKSISSLSNHLLKKNDENDHKIEEESRESLDDLIEMVGRELTSESEYSRYERELYEKVKASLEEKLASQMGRSQTELIQAAIEDYLSRNRRVMPRSIGMGISGRSDLSERDEEMLWQD